MGGGFRCNAGNAADVALYTCEQHQAAQNALPKRPMHLNTALQSSGSQWPLIITPITGGLNRRPSHLVAPRRHTSRSQTKKRPNVPLSRRICSSARYARQPLICLESVHLILAACSSPAVPFHCCKRHSSFHIRRSHFLTFQRLAPLHLSLSSFATHHRRVYTRPLASKTSFRSLRSAAVSSILHFVNRFTTTVKPPRRRRATTFVTPPPHPH